MLTKLICIAIGSLAYGFLQTATRFAPAAILAMAFFKRGTIGNIAIGLTAGAAADLGTHLITGNFDFLHNNEEPPEGANPL